MPILSDIFSPPLSAAVCDATCCRHAADATATLMPCCFVIFAYFTLMLPLRRHYAILIIVFAIFRHAIIFRFHISLPFFAIAADS
jgi:hypothetical protein